MKNFYTIDASTRFYKEFRLTSISTWRELDGYPGISSDDHIVFDSKDTLDYYKEGVVSMGGETYRANPKELNFSDQYVVFIYPVFHRFEVPRKFSMQEMREVIASGDDSELNSLVLDLNGRFSFMNTNLAMRNPNVAVRNEAFAPGNGYVGVGASEDRSFVGETYLGMLEGWLTHLKTGKLEVFVDCYEGESEQEMWAEVDSIFSK